ncbi:MAG: LacI family DNA-binding transcriptional regulator [Actinomycetota bacterium]
MDDVAERAGVSRSLVSLVFRNADNVSEHRRRAVLEAAEELGYRTNRLARNLAQGRSMTIGVVIDDLQNPFFSRILDGIEHCLAPSGYQVLLANGARSSERSQTAITTLAELQVDGLILVGTRGDEAALLSHARSRPTVLIARQTDSDLLDSVRVDELLGSRLAVEHLSSLGHCEIVHIDGGGGASAEERRNGYRAAMAEAGLQGHTEVLRGEFTHEAGSKAAVALAARQQMPSAVFAGNDLIAAGLWVQLERSGVSIPNDLSLVGFDDSSFPGFGETGLTTIRQPAHRIGDRAGELLLERLDGSRSESCHEAIPPTIVERSSTQRLDLGAQA